MVSWCCHVLVLVRTRCVFLSREAHKHAEFAYVLKNANALLEHFATVALVVQQCVTLKHLKKERKNITQDAIDKFAKDVTYIEKGQICLEQPPEGYDTGFVERFNEAYEDHTTINTIRDHFISFRTTLINSRWAALQKDVENLSEKGKENVEVLAAAFKIAPEQALFLPVNFESIPSPSNIVAQTNIKALGLVAKDVSWSTSFQGGIHHASCLGMQEMALIWEMTHGIMKCRSIAADLLWVIVQAKAARKLHENLEQGETQDALIDFFNEFKNEVASFRTASSSIVIVLCLRIMSAGDDSQLLIVQVIH